MMLSEPGEVSATEPSVMPDASFTARSHRIERGGGREEIADALDGECAAG